MVIEAQIPAEMSVHPGSFPPPTAWGTAVSSRAGVPSPSRQKATAARHQGVVLAICAAAATLGPRRSSTRRMTGSRRFLSLSAGATAVLPAEASVGLQEIPGEQPRKPLRMACLDQRLLTWAQSKIGNSLGEVTAELKEMPHLDQRVMRKGGTSQCRLAQTLYLQFILQADEIDFAVVAMKDLSLKVFPTIKVAAILEREDPREVLLRKAGSEPITSLGDLPESVILSAKSTRRSQQIKAQFPLLPVRDVPFGDVYNRLRMLHCGQIDAVVVGAAGLQRLGFRPDGQDCSWHFLDAEEVMPAFGQGAVGLLCLSSKEALTERLRRSFDHPPTRLAIETERSLAAELTQLREITPAGMADFLPDGQLRLRCVCTRAATPQEASTAVCGAPPASMVKAETVGPPEQAPKLVKKMVQEIAKLALDSLLEGLKEQAAAEVPAVQESTEESQGDEDEADDGEPKRPLIPIASVDCSGDTSYPGRVVRIFKDQRMSIVDIGCQVPVRILPEKSPTGEVSPLALGQEVSICCFSKTEHRLWGRVGPLPALADKGQGPRFSLESLKPKQGPFRAVVVSCTADGTFVDFHCEALGQLSCSLVYSPGQELDVYCYEVDQEQQTCTVGTVVQPGWRKAPPKRLEELDSTGKKRLTGRILRMPKGGPVVVDVNCEVPGVIELSGKEKWLHSFAVGHEVGVRVASIDAKRADPLLLKLIVPRGKASKVKKKKEEEGTGGGSGEEHTNGQVSAGRELVRENVVPYIASNGVVEVRRVEK